MESKVLSYKEEELSLERFRERVKEEKLEIPLDDANLLRFLRTRDFNVEAALTTVRRYLDWVKIHGERIRIPFNDCCKYVLENGIVNVLKRWDDQGRRIIYSKLVEGYNPNIITPTQLEVATWFMMEELSYYEDVQRSGLIVILDCQGIGLAKMVYYLTFFSLEQAHRFLNLFQGSIPAKVKGIYVIRTPLFVTKTYQAMKYLLKKKSRSRIHFSSEGFSSLHKHLGNGSEDWLVDKGFKLSDHLDREYIEGLCLKHGSSYIECKIK